MSQLIAKRTALCGGVGIFVGLLGVSCAVEAPGEIRQIEQNAPSLGNMRFGSVTQGASDRGDYHFTDIIDYSFITIGGDTPGPIVVVGDPSYNGSDPTTVRVRNVTPDGFETAHREWDYLNGVHTTETMGFLARAPGRVGYRDGFPVPPLGRSYGIDSAQVEGVTHKRKHVSFPIEFITPPLVFATQVTHNEDDPTIVRIWNVSTEGFDVMLQEERANDGSHTGETINYIAVETGVEVLGGFTYRFAGDTADECHFIGTFQTVTDEKWQTTGRLAEGHIVVGLQTKNGSDPANARWRPKTVCAKTSCKDVVEVRVDEEASDGESAHTNETVGGLSIWTDSCDIF